MSRCVELPPAGFLPDGAKPGGWWHETEEVGRLMCDLCPRECLLRPGDRGFCFVRENRDGQMVLSTYGRSTGFCIDPIEKKPLNHFHPGTSVLSFGTAGCNLGCKFCQNWDISKSREIERLSEAATPEAVAEAARRLGCRSVAFTYNDPVIWAEYAIDTARVCHAVGIKTVAVTAGYITPAARGAFYEHMDAANVDLKGFTEEFYYHLTLSHLAPVLDTLRWLKHETDVWFEITNLVIPQANDSLDEIGQMCDWILEAIGPDVPLHFTAFHPDFRLRDRPRTPAATLLAAYDVARARGLNYVYVGNVDVPSHHATHCPQCRETLIGRRGYDLTAYQLQGDRCGFCGAAIAGRFDARPGTWGSRRLPVRIADYAPPESKTPAIHPIARETVMADNLVQIEPAASPAAMELKAEHERAILKSAALLVASATLERPLHLPETALAGAAAIPVHGVFVSLKRQGRLRGCCGFVGREAPLAEALVHAAGRTANDDHRFPPVSPSELAHLDVEVWLLDRPQPVALRGELRREAVVIGKHGLQIAKGDARGLLLPGVAVEHNFDAEAFLQQVCLKAGLPPMSWKDDDASLMTFEGRAFQGSIGELADVGQAAAAAKFSAAELAALAEFCRSNVLAALSGATPSYYAYGVSDGNVYGVAITVEGPDGKQWISASRVSLRQSMPLQSTLYSLAENIGQTLARQRMDEASLASLQVGLMILTDPAMHGAVSEPDLRGLRPDQRALLVMERHRSSLAYDPTLQPEELLALAVQRTRLLMPHTAGVFSLAALSNRPRMVVTQGTVAQAGPSIRPPAVAGRFYPADAGELNRLVDQLMAGEDWPRETWPAVMAPHAGLIYSGQIAADVFRRVQIPETVIVLGPKHTPHGVDWAVAPHETWSIPGATLEADPRLARQLAEAIAGLELDAAAHLQEHAVEVELPLLARLAPKSKIVGITIGAGDLATCRRFAEGLARVIRTLPKPPLLVISSDMNHFATDAENRRLDEMALAAIERLDPELLLATCERNHISMCGVLPAVIVMETLRRLDGLTRSRRVGYGTSADVTGDTSRVVGYAGMLLG